MIFYDLSQGFSLVDPKKVSRKIQLTALRASKNPSPRFTSHRIHFSGTRVKVGPLWINKEAGSPVRSLQRKNNWSSQTSKAISPWSGASLDPGT